MDLGARIFVKKTCDDGQCLPANQNIRKLINIRVIKFNDSVKIFFLWIEWIHKNVISPSGKISALGFVSDAWERRVLRDMGLNNRVYFNIQISSGAFSNILVQKEVINYRGVEREGFSQHHLIWRDPRPLFFLSDFQLPVEDHISDTTSDKRSGREPSSSHQNYQSFFIASCAGALVGIALVVIGMYCASYTVDATYKSGRSAFVSFWCALCLTIIGIPLFVFGVAGAIAYPLLY